MLIFLVLCVCVRTCVQYVCIIIYGVNLFKSCFESFDLWPPIHDLNLQVFAYYLLIFRLFLLDTGYDLRSWDLRDIVQILAFSDTDQDR